MDASQNRGRSPSVGHQHHQAHISGSHSPSPARPFNSAEPNNIGLGIELDSSSGQPFDGTTNYANFNPFPGDTSFQGFNSQLMNGLEGDLPGAYQQQASLPPDFGNDFTIFPPTTGEQFNAPLFPSANNNIESPQLGQTISSPDHNNDDNMAQAHHQPTPPHLLNSDLSSHHSPSFNHHQFPPSPGHSRNVSLGPEAALLPGQDWSQYRSSHRRSPSEYSDVSSVGHPSPNLLVTDSFDHVKLEPGHSPMQRPQDPSVMQELHGIGGFTLSDRARSPSHSPAMSPRILPQQTPDVTQQSFNMANNGQYLGTPSQTYAAHGGQESFPGAQEAYGAQEAFPSYPHQQAPVINIFPAPPPVRSNVQGRSSLDTDALTPPERGRGRQRAVTDPYNNGSGRPSSPGGALSPHLVPSLSPNSGDSSRSLSPLDGRQSPGRRRQSTSAVPTNALALRLAEPEQGGESSGPKRAQKHPATFQCTLCPKRFTRAYNLRSHLRTHTDERPFVCTVCGKAFARQHDRKRHEGLHSGEKKFVCKGDLKAGGQWGCGRRFARADALGRHFRSEAGRICIKPLLDEELLERERQWGEQRMAHQHAVAAQQQQHMAMGGLMAPTMDQGFPAPGGYMLPQALLAQYPALANMDWAAPNMQGDGSGIDDEISNRSSFDASDYDQEDDAGYVSGPGTGFGPGGMSEGYGEMGYASDFGSGPRRQ